MRAERIALLAWAVLLAAALAVVAQARIATDLSAFLPRAPSAAQQVLVDQLREGAVAKVLLVALRGAEPPTLAQASHAMAARLRGDPRFASVDNGEAVDTERERAILFDNRYRLGGGPRPGSFEEVALREALQDSLDTLASPAGLALKDLVAADPTGETLRLLDTLGTAATPRMAEGVWFDASGNRALLALQTKATGFDLDAQEAALAAVRAAFADARPSPDITLELSGPAVFAVASREAIRGDAARYATAATVAIAVVLLLALRSLRLLLLAFVPVVTGAAAGVAAVALAWGEVHGITLGFGATLIGEAVDYGIYLIARRESGRSTTALLARVWPTIRLGMLTSVCGFGVLLFSGFPGLAQLGLFSAAGLVAAALTARHVLPALLPGRTVTPSDGLEALASGLLGGAARLRALPLLALAAGAGALAWQGGPMWNDTLAALSPVPVAGQALDQELREAMGAPDVRHVVVVRGNDREDALRGAEAAGAVLEALQGHDALQRFDSPAAFLPSAAAQVARAAALPDAATLRSRLESAARGLPLRTGSFEPFVQAVEATRAAPALVLEDLAGTRLELRVRALLAERPDGVHALMPLTGVRDADAVAAALAGLGAARAVLVDVKDDADALYRGYRREAATLALAGAGAVVLLLALALGSLRALAAVCLPLAAAVACTAAALRLLHGPLTLFHLVGLLLVVAVGSNYALFLVQGARERDTGSGTALSLLLAAGSTVLGFGLIGQSGVPVLAAIGTTVAAGAALALLFTAAGAPRGR